MSSEQISKDGLRPPTTMSRIEALLVGEELMLESDKHNLRSVRTAASLASRLHARKYTVITGKAYIKVVRLA